MVPLELDCKFLDKELRPLVLLSLPFLPLLTTPRDFHGLVFDDLVAIVLAVMGALASTLGVDLLT